ncbi:MAG TPA: tetratricopeptide repeat protein [Gemmatimonadaceae bacterium]
MDGLGLSSEEPALARPHDPGEVPGLNQDRTVQRSQESRLIAEIADAEQSFGPQGVQLLPPLAKLAASRIARGEAVAAAPVVLRALDISDRYRDDRPDLVLLLTDLTRLCIKQSAHTLAEPLLLRLLDLKRSKGDEHPEVATVLASLATVRQSLGQHEAAEQLWRRVVEIREKTLAPNHFAVATAIEKLGDSCSARGKISEALHHFKRALSMRELTLGPGHSSLRVLRERIADLELQAESAEELFAVDGSLSTSSLATTPVDYSPPMAKPQVIPAAKPRPVAIPVNEYAAPQVVTPPFATPPAPTALTAPATAAPLATQPSTAAAYRDLVLSIEKDLDGESNAPARNNPFPAAFAAVTGVLKDRRRALALAGSAVVVLLLSLAADSRAGTENEQTAGNGATVGASTLRVDARPAAGVITAAPVVTAPPKQPVETVRSAIASLISRSRPTEAKSEKRNEEKETPSVKVAIPKLSQSMLARADSVARSINTSTSNVADAAVPSQSMDVGSRAPLFNAEQETTNAPMRARLIGTVPTPRLPDQLGEVQALVKVWVRVDTSGRPVMSTFSIENSPNPLLTAAVRRVISDLRFEPARSGGANSRPVMDSVQVGFNFNRSR